MIILMMKPNYNINNNYYLYNVKRNTDNFNIKVIVIKKENGKLYGSTPFFAKLLI